MMCSYITLKPGLPMGSPLQSSPELTFTQILSMLACYKTSIATVKTEENDGGIWQRANLHILFLFHYLIVWLYSWIQDPTGILTTSPKGPLSCGNLSLMTLVTWWWVYGKLLIVSYSNVFFWIQWEYEKVLTMDHLVRSMTLGCPKEVDEANMVLLGSHTTESPFSPLQWVFSPPPAGNTLCKYLFFPNYHVLILASVYGSQSKNYYQDVLRMVLIFLFYFDLFNLCSMK